MIEKKIGNSSPECMGEAERKQQILRLNNQLRQTFKGGRIMTTSGIEALPVLTKLKILKAIQQFDDFSPENDPYGEHDFGAGKESGHSYFWKIDYYDQYCRQGSEDPANPEITTRVLTIMLAREY